MKFGVKIVKNKVKIEEYKENQEYADVLVDPYYSLRDLSNPKLVKYIKKANQEFARFVNKNISLKNKIVEDIKNIITHETKSPVIHSDKDVLGYIVKKNLEFTFVSIKNNQKYFLDSREKSQKNICGYFNYLFSTSYGFFYTITEDYSDNECLMIRLYGSKSIETDLLVDCKVKNVTSYDNLVFYTQWDHNPFEVKKLIQYDIDTGEKKVIYQVKGNNNTVIREIDYNHFLSVLLIKIEDGEYNSIILYDVKKKKSRIIKPHSKINYTFAFNQDYVLSLKTEKDSINRMAYLYLLDNNNFLNGDLKSSLIISSFNEKYNDVYIFGLTKSSLFYVVKNIQDNTYELNIKSLKTLKNIYHKIYEKVDIIDVYDTSLYDESKDYLILKVLYDNKVYFDTYKIDKETVRYTSTSYNTYNSQDIEYERVSTSYNGIPLDIILPREYNGFVVDVYGAYGVVTEPVVDEFVLTLLKNKVAYCYAHVRGSGALGKEWYQQGKLLNKKNTITDTLNVCKYISDKYLEGKNNIVLYGRSAGGIAVGGSMNTHPELFKGVILEMAFVDVLFTMLDETQPLTKLEYDEWGNPTDPKYYYYIKSYSPYQNVKPTNYPNVFIISAVKDERVYIHEGVKMWLKLKSNNLSKSKILLKVIPTGHFFEDNIERHIDGISDNILFILYCLNNHK